MSNTEVHPSAPNFAVAGAFLERLAAADFAHLDVALEPDATMRALLPSANREWEGAAAICEAFEKWFGDVSEYEVVDASVGQVGMRLQLRWRLRVVGTRFGEGSRLVEQNVYADCGPSGRIRSMALLCSGFCKEHGDA